MAQESRKEGDDFSGIPGCTWSLLSNHHHAFCSVLRHSTMDSSSLSSSAHIHILPSADIIIHIILSRQPSALISLLATTYDYDNDSASVDNGKCRGRREEQYGMSWRTRSRAHVKRLSHNVSLSNLPLWYVLCLLLLPFLSVRCVSSVACPASYFISEMEM